MDETEIELPEDDDVTQADLVRALFRRNPDVVFAPQDVKRLLPAIPPANVPPLLKRLSDRADTVRRNGYGRYQYDNGELEPEAAPATQSETRIRWAIPINRGQRIVAVTDDDRVLIAHQVQELAA